MRLREQVLQRREETLWQRFELLITAAEGPQSGSLVPEFLDHSNANSSTSSIINNNMSMTTMSMPVSYPARNGNTGGYGSVLPVSLPVPVVGSMMGQNKDY